MRGMQIERRHAPSFTVSRLVLAPEETVQVESGAMMAHSDGIQMFSKAAGGGIMKGLKRSVLSGESFFSTTFTAPAGGGWVDIAGVLPGDMTAIEIEPERPYFVARGNWMANSEGTEVTSKFGGMKNLFGGEGGFGLQASGQGLVVLSVYGAIDAIDLQPGERVVIDTGHLVAYDLAMQFTTRRAVSGRSFQSMKSGEGLVFEFTGPGRVYLQSRNPQSFADWAAKLMPSSNAQGGLGGLFN